MIIHNGIRRRSRDEEGENKMTRYLKYTPYGIPRDIKYNFGLIPQEVIMPIDNDYTLMICENNEDGDYFKIHIFDNLNQEMDTIKATKYEFI